MRALAAGDREALAPLMTAHAGRVYRIALSYVRNPDDATDVVQETFVKAFRHAPRWDERSPVGPWLTRIAVNAAIDAYRRGRRRRSAEEPLEEAPAAAGALAGGPSAERVVYAREQRERLARALQGLPKNQRAVVVLRHYQEMSLEEIAATLEMNLGTVKSSLHRGLARLRDVLQRH